jgi:hypothetical protein
MDLIGGLTAAKLAIDLAKDLRQIDRSVDEAGFKLKLADLTSALADTQVALSEARMEMIDKERKIRELEDSLNSATKGDLCPKCRQGRLSLVSTSRLRIGGPVGIGVEEWKYECGNFECDFQTSKLNDPQGLVSKMITKR